MGVTITLGIPSTPVTFEHHLYEAVAEHFGVDVRTLTPETRFVEDLHADEHHMEELRISFEDRLNRLQKEKPQVLFHDDFDSVKTLGELVALVNAGRTI